MVDGIALKNTTVCYEDFGFDGDAGSLGSTCDNTGPAQIVPVLKCALCGHSVLGDLEDIGTMVYTDLYEEDDGNFPNYSDKDVWLNGFIAGYNYLAKIWVDSTQKGSRIKDV